MTVTPAAKTTVLFIFIAVLVDVIGVGIIVPVVPELIMQLTGEGLSRAAVYGGWLGFTYAVMQLFCAPVLGVMFTAPLFGIVPVRPRPLLLENVLPLSKSACTAVPALTVVRSAEQLA